MTSWDQVWTVPLLALALTQVAAIAWLVIRCLAAVGLVEIVGAPVASGWPPAAGPGRAD